MSRRSVPKPIYGLPCPVPLCQAVADPNEMSPALFSLFAGLLREFTGTVVQTAINVAQFFPGTTAFARIIAPMGATVTMSPALMMRFIWMKAHPGIIFDPTNQGALLQLQDLYLQYGYDWTTDKVLNGTNGPVITPLAPGAKM